MGDLVHNHSRIYNKTCYHI